MTRKTVLEKYQSFTPTTATYPEESELEYLGLELASEAGEVAGKIKKKIRGDANYQDPDDFREIMIKEMSDVMYPISQLCNYLGLSIEEVLKYNMKKLSKRLSEGTIKGDGDDR